MRSAVIFQLAILSVALFMIVASDEPCYEKIRNLIKYDEAINSTVNEMIVNKEFRKLQKMALKQIKSLCDEKTFKDVLAGYKKKKDVVVMVKKLAEMLTPEERLKVKEMALEKNKNGIYGFFAAKAMNVSMDPEFRSLLIKLSTKFPLGSL